MIMDQFVEAYSKELLKEAASIDMSLSAIQAERLLQHLCLILDANKQTNLTRIVDPQEAVTKHVVDSLMFVPALEDTNRVIDIGTGAGYPGIPLHVVRDQHTTLLDSSQKKCAVLTSIVDELALVNTSVVCLRAEDHARDCRSAYDAVVARAVAPLPVLLEYAAPLLSIDGLAVFSKGVNQELVEDARRAAEICGFELVSRETQQLPRDEGARLLLGYKKIRESEIELPRRPGVANKRPL